MKKYQSIIDMLNRSILAHKEPKDDYQKWYLDWMREAVAEIEIAQTLK